MRISFLIFLLSSFALGDTLWQSNGINTLFPTNAGNSVLIGGSPGDGYTPLIVHNVLAIENSGYYYRHFVPTLGANVSLMWPKSNAAGFLQNDGSGNLSWGSGGGGGSVTSVGLADTTSTSVFTITNSPITSTGNLGIACNTASASQPGCLSAANWSTFNGKQNVLTLGNLTSPTTGVSIGSGTGSVIGTGTTVSIQTASGSQPGLLSSTDWTTFNGKQASGSYLTALTGDVTASGPGSAAATLASTAVTPGSYTSTNLTVDAKGRITAASNGSGGGVAWGSITGTLSSQTDLQTALNAKAIGPGSSTAGQLAAFSGTDGQTLKALLHPTVDTNGGTGLDFGYGNGSTATLFFGAPTNSIYGTTTNLNIAGTGTVQLVANNTSFFESVHSAGSNGDLNYTLMPMAFEQVATPPSIAPSGADDLYTKSDDNLYLRNHAGTETKVNTGGTITAITGDLAASGSGSVTGTLANTAVTPGSYTSTNLTVDSKGRITSASNGSGGGITALTGDVTASGSGSVAATLAATTNSTLTTLSGLTSASSLATVGTIGTGTWNGTTIAVNHGGTGLATLTANNVILGNGTSNPLFVAPSTSGNLLTSNGTTWQSTAPSFASSTLLSGKFYLGNGSNVATATTLTGDVTAVNTGATTVNFVNGTAATAVTAAVTAVNAANPNGTSGDLVTIGGTSPNTFLTVENIIGPNGPGNYTTMSPASGTWSGFDGNIAVSIADHYNLVDRSGGVSVGWSDRVLTDGDGFEDANWGNFDYEMDISHLGGDLGNGAPSVSPDVGAGTGGTATASVNSSDLAWQVTIVTGTLPTGSNAIIATYTLGQNFQDGNAPTAITISPMTASAATAMAAGVHIEPGTTPVGQFNIVSGAAGLTASTTYTFCGVIVH